MIIESEMNIKLLEKILYENKAPSLMIQDPMKQFCKEKTRLLEIQRFLNGNKNGEFNQFMSLKEWKLQFDQLAFKLRIANQIIFKVNRFKHLNLNTGRTLNENLQLFIKSIEPTLFLHNLNKFQARNQNSNNFMKSELMNKNQLKSLTKCTDQVYDLTQMTLIEMHLLTNNNSPF